jgi:uncharacterized membrane protein
MENNHYKKLAIIGIRIFAVSFINYGFLAFIYSLVLLFFQNSEFWLYISSSILCFIFGLIIWLTSKKIGKFISKNLED